MKNIKTGLGREAKYRATFDGKSAMRKTLYTYRQIDIFKEDKWYMGQLKTGKLYFTDQVKNRDLPKDAYFVQQGYTVVIEAKIKPENVRGVLKIHQSNPSGVCRKCIQGLDNDIVKPAVLKQLSLKYPNLRIEVTSEVLPNVKVSGKSNFVIMNGKYIQ